MTPEQARIGGLTRFAIGITIFNLLGHTILGFETSVVQVMVCAITAYLTEIILEAVGAWGEKRSPLFAGGLKQLVIFLMPAHISGFAISMLLYPGDRLWPFVFATTLAIASKSIFTVTVGGRRRHFLNPSNTGIVASIFLFPSVSAGPPYHFTEYLFGYWYWVLPAFFLCFGSFLNAVFTKKVPLVATWLIAFVMQAVIRHYLYPTWLPASLAPMTGVAFLLFTFYMITDPQTSPSGICGQVMFGLSLGTAYGLLMGHHVVYALFLALFFVCVGRGVVLYVCELTAVRQAQTYGKRLWLTSIGRLPEVNLPVAARDMMQRFPKP
jgi:enediyne biosynthesis protein E5